MRIYHVGLIACMTVGSCKTEETARAPVITNFSPQSGIGRATFRIGGTGFAASPNNNYVSISGADASVIKATPLELTVAAPDVFTTGKIKVVVNGDQTVTSIADFVRNYEMRTLAGSTFGFSDGSGSSAKFYGPSGIAIGPDGNIFLADSENHRIRRITPDGVTTTVAGTDANGFVDGPLATAQFGSIRYIAVDPNRNIFVTEYMSGAIRKISNSGIVSVFAGSVTTLGDVDATGSNARFGHLGGLVADQNGNIYVVDISHNKVRKITADGVVSTFAGAIAGTADGIGTAAQFNFKNLDANIAIDASGNLYVTDIGNGLVRKITQAGIVTSLPGVGFALAGISVDSKGNIYVIDYLKALVRKISPDGAIATVAGTTVGFKDGDATTAQLNNPLGIAVDQFGNLFIADANNNRLRKLVP